MVVVVRDHLAELVQLRGPRKFAPRVDVGVGHGGVEERQRHGLHARCLRRVDTEAPLQLRHGGVAHVARARALQHGDALVQIDDHALAQRAARRLHLGDVEVGRQRVEDGQPAAEHGAAIGFQPRQVQLLDLFGSDALFDAPAQAFRRDAPVAHTRCLQDLRYRADGSRRAQRLAPVFAPKGPQGFFKLGTGSDLRRAKGGIGDLAVAEEALRQADAADGERLGQARDQGRAEDHLGRPPADVDHKARLVAGLQVRDADVDEARLFAARDDLDVLAQSLLRAQQKGVAVARFTQRLCGHGAHALRCEARQPRGKAAQADQAALHGFFGEHAVGVEAGTQAHGLLQVVDAAIAFVVDLRDLQAKTVRAHVHRSERPVEFGDV